jgi:hypothetical protein
MTYVRTVERFVLEADMLNCGADCLIHHDQSESTCFRQQLWRPCGAVSDLATPLRPHQAWHADAWERKTYGDGPAREMFRLPDYLCQ